MLPLRKISFILIIALNNSCVSTVDYARIAPNVSTVTFDEPIQAAVCDIYKDPASYNRKKIQVTGFISRGFENSSLFDPKCSSSSVSIWVETGGKERTGVVYCCGVPASKKAEEELKVEGITLPLIDDDKFTAFEKEFAKIDDSIMQATVIGTFFSGEKRNFPGGEAWSGFGHFGMSSLFVVQQIVSFEPRNRKDVTYRATGAEPDLKKEACDVYEILDDLQETFDFKQERAESGESWRFDDPKRVATEDLARELKIDPLKIKLQKEKEEPGSITYYWRPNGKKGVRYMVQVLHPYLLAYKYRDIQNVAWISEMYKICD